MTREYKRPAWAVDQIVRASGLVEDICKHGVGHPNEEWLRSHCLKPETYHTWSIHGCDGCCSEAVKECLSNEQN